MTINEALKEVNRLAAKACKTPAGPDYAAIVASVASENGINENDLREAIAQDVVKNLRAG